MDPTKISQHITCGGTKGSELRTLYGLASQLPPDAVVVEIGSAQGRSTLVLAKALCDGNSGIVYAIDPLVYNAAIPSTWGDNETALRENITRSGLTNIEIIQEFSSRVGESFDRPIHLLFIDGDHSYDAVRSDYELFSPHLVPGGVIAFHDVGVVEGPKRLVAEEIYGNPAYSGLRTVRTMLYAVKTPGSHRGQWYHRAKHEAYFQLSRVHRKLLALKPK